MNKYQISGRGNPCPICGRGGTHSEKQGADCRILEFENVILCHTYRSKSDDINGYKFIRETEKGAGWGVWVWAKQADNGKVIGRKQRPKLEQRQIEEYPDRDGSNLIRVVRQKGASVEFYQEYWVAGEWLSASKVDDSLKEAMRRAVPIYRYHEVQAAIERGDLVFFVEGESCANALWEIGIAATTTIGGSKAYRNWGTDYKADLANAKLVLCPDRDKAGLAYIDEVAKDFPKHQLYKPFKTSPIWEFLPDAGGLDVADEIATGITAEAILSGVIKREDEKPKTGLSYSEVLDAIDALEAKYENENELDWYIREFVAEAGLKTKGYSSSALLKLARARRDGERAVELVDAIDILNSGSDGRQWIIPGLIPLGSTIVFAASGGVGKTTCIYNIAKHVALGKPWSSLPVMQGKVLIIQTDEPQVDIKDKLEISGYSEVPKGQVSFITKWRFSQIRQLEQVIKQLRPVLVAIDSYTAAHAGMGAELTKSSAGDNIYTLRDIAQDYGCSFVIIHHHNKLNELRDSSTINDNASEIWSLARDEKISSLRNDFVLSITKSRAGLAGRYVLQRNPVDYSWLHCGQVEGTDLKVLEVMDALKVAYPSKLSALNVGDRINLGTYEAQAALEQARRLGLIQSEWIQWTDPEGIPGRFRVYSAHPESVGDESNYQGASSVSANDEEGEDF